MALDRRVAREDAQVRLSTSGLVPVAHGFSHTSTPGWSGSEFSPVDPEWPSTVIEFGYPPVHSPADAGAAVGVEVTPDVPVAALVRPEGSESEPPQPARAAAPASTTALTATATDVYRSRRPPRARPYCRHRLVQIRHTARLPVPAVLCGPSARASWNVATKVVGWRVWLKAVWTWPWTARRSRPERALADAAGEAQRVVAGSTVGRHGALDPLAAPALHDERHASRRGQLELTRVPRLRPRPAPNARGLSASLLTVIGTAGRPRRSRRSAPAPRRRSLPVQLQRILGWPRATDRCPGASAPGCSRAGYSPQLAVGHGDAARGLRPARAPGADVQMPACPGGSRRVRAGRRRTPASCACASGRGCWRAAK